MDFKLKIHINLVRIYSLSCYCLSRHRVPSAIGYDVIQTSESRHLDLGTPNYPNASELQSSLLDILRYLIMFGD